MVSGLPKGRKEKEKEEVGTWKEKDKEGMNTHCYTYWLAASSEQADRELNPRSADPKVGAN